MSPNFRTLAIVSSTICYGLALVLLLAPDVLLSMWNVAYTYPVGLVGRRTAALFLGIGFMFQRVRNAEPSPSRTAIGHGFAVACLALAGLGSYELVTGHAGPGILTAVITELLIAFAFLRPAQTSPSSAETGEA